MKAFVGYSFSKQDASLIRKIIEFLESSGIKCETGEKAENASVAGKVKDRIDKNDIFVGIFTSDKEVILRWQFFGIKKETSYTTSNWVIQESGYAIGKDRELIFIVENCICKFPKLQGDLELIYFNRNSLDKLFLRLTQVIECVKNKRTAVTYRKMKTKAEDLEKPELENQRNKVEDEIKDKKRSAFKKLLDTIFIEKDYRKLQKVYDDEFKKTLTRAEQKRWKAFVLRYSHSLGDSSAFSKLVKYVQKNKNVPGVVYHLAHRYKDMREYEKAKDQFLILSKLYDVDKPKGKIGVVKYHGEASMCLALDGKCNEAIDLLRSLLTEEGFAAYKATVLTRLARVAEIADDWEKFSIYAEGALNVDPSDSALRFDLAYKYSEKGCNKLSLLHYKKVNSTTQSGGGLNNMAVQYATLHIPTESVKSYFRAADLNNTLAMANIAERYLNEGFAEDAEKIITRANKLANENIEVHGNVGATKTKLDRMLADAEEKEKGILLDGEREREFRSRYSEAYCSTQSIKKEKFGDVWETPWGEFKISYDEEKGYFNVTESYVRQSVKHENYKETTIIIEGSIVNMSGKCDIKITDTFEYKYMSTDEKIIHQSSAFLIISEDCNRINVMEKMKEDETLFNCWKKVIRKPIYRKLQ